MARQEFPKSVKVAAMKRCMEATGFPVCEGCGTMIKGRFFAFDHDNPDGLTGEPTLKNCKVLCSGFTGSCHAVKTAEDVGNIARAKRREAKHLGVGKRQFRPMPGSKQSPWKAKFGGGFVRREER